jgi:hypothetical protein
MRNLIRSPLTWMVAAELVVVGALIAVAWNVLASANRAGPPTAVAAAQEATDEGSADGPPIPRLGDGPARGPLPGLALDPAFWRQRLGELNGDQVYFEQLEWQIVHSAEEAVHRYLETVVLPAIQRAEHAGGAVVL